MRSIQVRLSALERWSTKEFVPELALVSLLWRALRQKLDLGKFT